MEVGEKLLCVQEATKDGQRGSTSATRRRRPENQLITTS